MLNKKLIKTLSAVALAGVLAFTPLTANATTTQQAPAAPAASAAPAETPAAPAPATNVVTAADGTKIVSQIPGHYSTKSVGGAAILTDKASFAAAVGATGKDTVSVKVVDTQCGPMAKQSINDGIAALAAAGVNAKQVAALDLLAFVNKKEVINAATPYTFTVALPKSELNSGAQYGILLIQRGGIVTFFPDLDGGANTVTCNLTGFGVACLVRIG